MFKGLKSKLEDEAKKLQASVQQSVENISQQYRTASETGSDAGSSITRRFLNTVGGSPSQPENLHSDSLNYSVGNALMEEVNEEDLLGIGLPKRERRWSGGSTHSNESSLSTMFQSVPGMASNTLETLDSDQESTFDEHNSAVVRSASKEQISSVLSKLQGRADNYKDKYRDLVKKYNQVVTENNKCRTVLVQTQDKALNTIDDLRKQKKVLVDRLREAASSEDSTGKFKKMEDLLDKCKSEISKNRAKIKELGEENMLLKNGAVSAEGESGMSMLAAERVAAEWKQRIDKVEEEWTERTNKTDSDHAIQLATTKADMHAALENKDKEIESWRGKCRTLEVQDGQANERWQKRVDELQSIVQAMETEKTDMVEKLSAAKQQGVQAVRDEEETKREQLLTEWREKELEIISNMEKRIAEVDAQHLASIDSLKHQLTTEANSRSDESTFKHNSELQDDKRRLEALVEEFEQKLRSSQSRVSELECELVSAMDFSNQKHRSEVADLISEHDEIVAQTKSQLEFERSASVKKYEDTQNELNQLRSKTDHLYRELEQKNQIQHSEAAQREKNLEEKVLRLESELNGLRSKADAEKVKLSTDHNESVKKFAIEIEDLKQALEERSLEMEEMVERAAILKKQSEEELTELKTMLDDRNATVRRLEDEHKELEAELASAKELSAMHEHLRTELEEAHKQRIAVEIQVQELAKRAESAEKSLEEDRSRLAHNQQQLEESMNIKRIHVDEALQSSSSVVGETNLLDFGVEPAESVDEASNMKVVRERLSQLEERNATLEQELNKIMLEKDELCDKITSTTDREEETQAHLSQSQQTVSELEVEKNSLCEQMEHLQLETSALLSDMQKRLSETECMCEALRAEVNTLSEVKASMEAVAENNIQEISNLEQQVHLLNSRLEENQAAQHSEDSLLEKFKNELVIVREQHHLIEKECKQAKDDVQLLTEAIEQKELDSQSAASIVEQLKNDKEHLITKLGDLQKVYDQARASGDDLQQNINKLEAELKSFSDDHTMKSTAVEELETALLAEKIRIDKLEAEYKHKLKDIEMQSCNYRDEVEVYKAQLHDVNGTLERMTTETETASSSKIREHEVLNERMRVEFIAKENVLSELRHELESAQKLNCTQKQELEARIGDLKMQLESALNEMSNSSETLEQQRVLMATLEKTAVERRTNEIAEEAKIREQYSSALENLKLQLATSEENLKVLSSAQSEVVQVKAELGALKLAHSESETLMKEASETALAELKQKAEKKIAKLKATAENDIAAAKAELMLQVDELRSSVSERDRRLDDASLEKARLEQQIIASEDIQSELDQKREKEKQLSLKLSELERRLMELEADNTVLRERKAEFEITREQLSSAVEHKSSLVNDLEDKVKSLESANEENFRKAAVKQDSESKKVIRELQREVKQLYVELNEKTEKFDNLQSQVDGNTTSKEVLASKASNMKPLDTAPQRDFMYEEELETMRKKLNECHKEIDSLKDMNSKMERSLDTRKNTSPAVIPINGANHCESSGFADPAEAEYLKNVLYRYMAERETLGKECVTLARVIGTVAKFNRAQLDAVLHREESRVAGWVEGTVNQVSNVLTGTRH